VKSPVLSRTARRSNLRYDRHHPPPARRSTRGGEIRMSRFRHIQTNFANGVETITLNRPNKRNALCRS
jgi:hypothetical protein